MATPILSSGPRLYVLLENKSNLLDTGRVAVCGPKIMDKTENNNKFSRHQMVKNVSKSNSYVQGRRRKSNNVIGEQ